MIKKQKEPVYICFWANMTPEQVREKVKEFSPTGVENYMKECRNKCEKYVIMQEYLKSRT